MARPTEASGQQLTRCIADVSYGPAPANTLDICVPLHNADNPGRDLPILLFIHGGGFTHGPKAWNGFMAPLLAALPAVLVSIDHRLIPEVDWPTPFDDCCTALNWIHAHIARYGGSPERIFVGAHSAGSALATLLAMQPTRHCAAVRGVVNISGSFNRLAITGTAGSELVWPAGPMPVDGNAPLALPCPTARRSLSYSCGAVRSGSGSASSGLASR